MLGLTETEEQLTELLNFLKNIPRNYKAKWVSFQDIEDKFGFEPDHTKRILKNKMFRDRLETINLGVVVRGYVLYVHIKGTPFDK